MAHYYVCLKKTEFGISVEQRKLVLSDEGVKRGLQTG